MLEAQNTTVTPPGQCSTQLTSNAADADTSVSPVADAKDDDDGKQHGWHEDARTVHRTTVSNVECHKNIRTMMVVKVPLLSMVGSESMVAIVPEHLVKVFYFCFLCACR